MSVTFGRPSVSVPVLSRAIKVILPSVSSTAPPLISSPRRAPAARPAAMAAGVEMTSAQGQPTRSTASLVDPLTPGLAGEERRQDGDEEAEDEDNRRVVTREAVDETLRRGLGLLRLLNKAHHTRDGVVLSRGGDLHA